MKVICAAIVINDKFLVVQRSEKMSLPLKWEFPGGKIEANETEEECIIREIKEELNIEINPTKRLTPSKYDYPNISIELIPYLANYKSGRLILKEHLQYKLLSKEELRNLEWAEADLPIVNEIIKL
jgi:8-oxo-dGTP diphosphatase